ncbi:hypothetical protein HRbin01_01775 [archaeon HR01]|nr:hypothetical protein HRbin01_01775 [archaeon HR01]
MEPFDTIVTSAIVGAASGFSLGLTGMGWGSISVPLLILLGFDHSAVIGTVLTSNVLASAAGGAVHWRNKNSDRHLIFLLTLSGVMLAILGALFSLSVKPRLVSIILSIYLLVGGIGVLLSRSYSVMEVRGKNSIRFFAAGAVPGFFEGAYGSGGPAGVLSLLLLRVHAHRAVGSWLPASLMIQLAPSILYLATFNFDWTIFLGLIGAGIPATIIGSRFTKKIPEKVLRFLIGLIIFLLGVRLLVRIV